MARGRGRFCNHRGPISAPRLHRSPWRGEGAFTALPRARADIRKFHQPRSSVAPKDGRVILLLPRETINNPTLRPGMSSYTAFPYRETPGIFGASITLVPACARSSVPSPRGFAISLTQAIQPPTTIAQWIVVRPAQPMSHGPSTPRYCQPHKRAPPRSSRLCDPVICCFTRPTSPLLAEGRFTVAGSVKDFLLTSLVAGGTGNQGFCRQTTASKVSSGARPEGQERFTNF